jgi:hypothetical protein
MPSPGQSSLFNVFSELVTTTYRNHSAEVADNVSNHNALYGRLISKGRKRREDGGLSIVANLEYAENGTYQRYDGYDELNIQAVDVLTAAEFAWKQVAINVAASGREIRMNSGENRIVNLVKTKIGNAKKSAANGLSSDMYSSGSLPNQINGIQALIADAGTGTVGGINSATAGNEFWQNIVQSAAAPLQGGAAIVPGPTTIESLMLPLYLRLTRGADHPDLIVFDESYFTFYEQSQTSLKRYAPSDEGQGGMLKMKYKQADVVHDSAASGIPSAHGYFTNTDYLELVVHEDADLEIIPELRSINQDAVVTPILWMGNLVTSNRSLQGVMKA